MENEKQTIPFTEEAVKDYLDSAIRKWRRVRQTQQEHIDPTVTCCINVFQSVRTALFGELLPKE